MFSPVSGVAHGIEFAQGFEVGGFLLEHECFDDQCPCNGAYNYLSCPMSNIRRVLGNALGNFMGVLGNLMDVLGILVCALLKTGLSGC